jgi:hypothetical protein
MSQTLPFGHEEYCACRIIIAATNSFVAIDRPSSDANVHRCGFWVVAAPALRNSTTARCVIGLYAPK